MLEQNRPIHEFTGVARFHAAGYTGSRARAATGEVLVPEDWDGTIQRCKQDTNYSPEEYPQAWEIYSE